MLTRGHYIGQIIDDFSALEAQVKMRNALGFTDLSVFAENFFRDILNILLDVKLVNLNASRSNVPGIDLGDAINKLAFQITASATGAKVDHTLKQITSDQAALYEKFFVLGINKAQKTYKIDSENSAKYSFTEDNIWDIKTLARKAVDLEIEPLQRLYQLVNSNSARLKVELEMPDEQGKYPTSGYDSWEVIANPKIGDGRAFAEFYEDFDGDSLTKLQQDVLIKSLQDLGAHLSGIPRVSREFLATLYERRETKKTKRFSEEHTHLLLSKLERMYSGNDFRGELEILEHAGFIFIDAEDQREMGPAEIRCVLPVDSAELNNTFVDFVTTKNLSFRNVIGAADLSDF